MKNILKKIFSRRVEYTPLIEVRVFKDAILHNVKEFHKTYPKLKFAPVLKSNAYGHGLVQVAGILDKENLPFFMVDSFFEALQLRREEIKTPVLILGYNRLQQVVNNKLKNVSFGIIGLQQLEQISQNLKQSQKFHLKIDTGMHRQGILVSEISEAVKLIKSNQNIILEGLCSHFADADGNDTGFTKQQIKVWNEAAAIFKKEFPNIKYFHVSNTAGSYFQNELDVNVGRLGIGTYGINQSPFEKLNLKPALELVSVISSVKNILPGDKVGYGASYEAKSPRIVATVPVGYNEGVDRRLFNLGIFKVQNIDCPIMGKVSMNMSSIDVSEIRNLELEQEVVVISKNPEDKNSVENIAKVCQTIPYEILVHIPSYLKRTVI